MYMFRKRYSSAIVVMALLLVAAVAGVAFAGSSTPSGTDRATQYQDMIAKLAGNLGVDPDKVSTAMETTKKQMLNEAVQRGDITQEQADKMAAQKGGCFGMFGGGPNGEKRGFHGRGGFMGEDAEKILGISQDQIKEEMQSGKTWEQILSNHGMTMEQFHQKMLEIRKEALTKDVSDGKLTQDQADEMIQRMQQCQKSSPKTNN